jgi:SAM-dependent methyltransferase
VFSEPQPSDAVLRQAYATSYGNYRGERSLLERVAEPLARREAARLIRHCDPSAPLLELGCGTGRFLERMRHAGWTGPVGGAEFSPDVARATSARLGVPIEAASAEDADLGSHPLGALVLRHVIEHLRDPAPVLRRVRVALAPDGVLYVATPDTRALASEVFGRYWWGYEIPRHLLVFSSRGLRGLLEAQDFEIVDEWWGYSPQMWNASLYLALDRGRGRHWPRVATHALNPLVSAPAAVLAGAEVLLRRSTMYALVARARQ